MLKSLLFIDEFQHLVEEVFALSRLCKAHGLIPERRKVFGHRHCRCGVQALYTLEAVLYVVARHGIQHVLRELIGVGGGYHYHLCGVLFVLFEPVERNLHSAAGVSVHSIARVAEQVVNGLNNLVLVGEAAVEIFGYGRLFFGSYVVFALVFQIVHQLFGARGVPAAYLEQKPFEVGRDEDIHRGRSSFIEVAVGIVLAACKEVGEDIVHIGSTVQAPYGQSHTLCVVRGEYVAEVARGDGKDATCVVVIIFSAEICEVSKQRLTNV